MMFALLAAVLDLAPIDPMALSGSLSGTGSTSTVTGSTRTWTVPAGNTGQIEFENVSHDGSGDVEYEKNGGGFVVITNGSSVTFANGDTIRMRATGLASSETALATLRDLSSNTVFGPYTWVRT